MSQNIPHYLSNVGVQKTLERIENPEKFIITDKAGHVQLKPISYEHQVGSFAFTIIKHVFSEPKWVITAEMFDSSSNKKPDITIEQVVGEELQVHALFELKKLGGGRMEEAVQQTVDAIVETIDIKGQAEGEFEVFVIVQRGLNIAFFEYHNDRSNLDEDGIPHFMGCTSLTQAYNNEPAIVDPGQGVNNLFFDYKHLRNSSPVRREAALYRIPCVFDVRVHEKEVNALFHHIATKKPRSS